MIIKQPELIYFNIPNNIGSKNICLIDNTNLEGHKCST